LEPIDMKTILLIGCGSIGQRHARLLSERKDVRLWACDSVPANLELLEANAKAEKRFTNFQEGLREKPDLVWVCTPESSHAPISIAALENGAHVFCEKPLANTLDAGKQIQKAVHNSQKVFAVGYTFRYTKVFKTIKNLIDQKAAGNIVGAQVCLGSYETLRRAKTDSYVKQPWGLLLTYTHEIDYLRCFLGPVRNVAGFQATLGQMEKKADPNVIGSVFQFQPGSIATVFLDYVQDPSYRSISLIGDKGKISFVNKSPNLEVFKYDTGQTDLIDIAQNPDEPYIAEHNEFFKAVENQSAAIVDVDDACETLSVAFRLIDYFKSAK
jgi:UDP-N-acetylglucosamine 3-dehydrogenase